MKGCNDTQEDQLEDQLEIHNYTRDYFVYIIGPMHYCTILPLQHRYNAISPPESTEKNAHKIEYVYNLPFYSRKWEIKSSEKQNVKRQ